MWVARTLFTAREGGAAIRSATVGPAHPDFGSDAPFQVAGPSTLRVMSTERRLTATESFFVHAGFGSVTVSNTVTGHVDPEVLDRAWRLLAHDYPLLRCVIRPTDGGFTQALLDTVPAIEAGLNGFLAELTKPLAGVVSRLSLRQSPDTAVVTLAVDHALSDARLVTTLSNTLLRHYTTLLGGGVPESTPRPVFEPAMEDRLLGRYEPGWPEPPATPGTPVCLRDGARDRPGFGTHNLRFDPGATAAITAVARKNRVSVTELVCGALSRAVRDRFPDDDGPLPVAMCVPIDFRPRLTPPAPPDAQFNAVLAPVLTVPVGAGDDPADVGRRYGAELCASLDRDEPQRALVAQCRTPMSSMPPQPPFSLTVSSLGVIESPVLPDGMSVTDTRFAGLLYSPTPMFFVSTSAGRLNLDVVYARAYQSAAQIGSVMGAAEASLCERVRA